MRRPRPRDDVRWPRHRLDRELPHPPERPRHLDAWAAGTVLTSPEVRRAWRCTAASWRTTPCTEASRRSSTGLEEAVRPAVHRSARMPVPSPGEAHADVLQRDGPTPSRIDLPSEIDPAFAGDIVGGGDLWPDPINGRVKAGGPTSAQSARHTLLLDGRVLITEDPFAYPAMPVASAGVEPGERRVQGAGSPWPRLAGVRLHGDARRRRAGPDRGGARRIGSQRPQRACASAALVTGTRPSFSPGRSRRHRGHRRRQLAVPGLAAQRRSGSGRTALCAGLGRRGAARVRPPRRCSMEACWSSTGGCSWSPGWPSLLGHRRRCAAREPPLGCRLEPRTRSRPTSPDLTAASDHRQPVAPTGSADGGGVAGRSRVRSGGDGSLALPSPIAVSGGPAARRKAS